MRGSRPIQRIPSSFTDQTEDAFSSLIRRCYLAGKQYCIFYKAKQVGKKIFHSQLSLLPVIPYQIRERALSTTSRQRTIAINSTRRATCISAIQTCQNRRWNSNLCSLDLIFALIYLLSYGLCESYERCQQMR